MPKALLITAEYPILVQLCGRYLHFLTIANSNEVFHRDVHILLTIVAANTKYSTNKFFTPAFQHGRASRRRINDPRKFWCNTLWDFPTRG